MVYRNKEGYADPTAGQQSTKQNQKQRKENTTRK